MEKKFIIRGTINLIPNPSNSWESYRDFCKNNTLERLSRYGVVVQEDDYLQDVDCKSLDGTSMSNHGYKEVSTNNREEYINSLLPKQLPYSLLSKFKEGENILLENEEAIFILKVSQSTCKYRNWGNSDQFENVLEELMEIGRGIHEGTWEVDLHNWCWKKKEEQAV